MDLFDVVDSFSRRKYAERICLDTGGRDDLNLGDRQSNIVMRRL